jgi:hypothetical protein
MRLSKHRLNALRKVVASACTHIAKLASQMRAGMGATGDDGLAEAGLWQRPQRVRLQPDSMLHLQRRLLPAPTFAMPTEARKAQLLERMQHLDTPSGLVEHEWQALAVAAESVHALEQRLHAQSASAEPAATTGEVSDEPGVLCTGAVSLLAAHLARSATQTF